MNSKLQSKNLTAVIPNTKPVNAVVVPTTGGRRIRRVKKSRPGSLFSLAGKRVKSRRHRKVKSSKPLISLAGAKSRRYRRSKSRKSRKSTGGRKMKRSKSRKSKSRKSKSKLTGGKRHYRRH